MSNKENEDYYVVMPPKSTRNVIINVTRHGKVKPRALLPYEEAVLAERDKEKQDKPHLDTKIQ